MHLSEVDVTLTAADLRGLFLALRPADTAMDLEEVAIAGPELRVRVRADALPLPVELVATIARVEPEQLILKVDLGNMGFLPGTLRTAALDFFGSKVTAPGITFRGGELSLATAALARALPARFALAAATLGEGRLRLTLRDVEVAPAPAGPGPGAPPPAAPAAAGLPPERPVAAEHRAAYQAIRDRLAAFLDRNLPPWLQPAVPWLLLLPDFLVLLARLAADPRVTGRAKLVAAGALAYLALPTDLLPDFLPGLGLLDDVAVALLALEVLVAMSPAELVQEHWPGDRDVLATIRGGLEWAGTYFPKGMVRRLREWLRRRGETPS